LFLKKGKGAVHWRAGANQPAQPAKPAQPARAASTSIPARSDTAAPRAPDRVRPTAPRGRHALLAGATTPPPLWTAPPPPPFSPPPGARSLALSRAFSPPLRAHSSVARHRSSPSSVHLVPGTPSPSNASFHLSELCSRLRVLGRDFFARVSGPRGPNRSPESARPRRSSPRKSASLAFSLSALSCLASARIMVAVTP